MGRTGDAEGTPYHLHFEVHPVSFLYLGYDGAVDRRRTSTPGAISRICRSRSQRLGALDPRRPGSPEPGAILLGMSDISTADGLDPPSLQRAEAAEALSLDADARADSARADERPRSRLIQPGSTRRSVTSSRRRTRRSRRRSCPSATSASPAP
jgi:hypothetical protein